MVKTGDECIKMRLVCLEDIENALNRNLGCGTNAFKIVRNVETIDPETLPVVKELRLELEKTKKERDENAKYLDMATQDISNYIGLYKKMEDERDEIAELCAQLIVLCNPPKSWIPKLFRPLPKRVGDYMGSGYGFIDSFNKIFDSFTENATDEVYKAVESAIKMESCIKYSEIEE